MLVVIILCMQLADGYVDFVRYVHEKLYNPIQLRLTHPLLSPVSIITVSYACIYVLLSLTITVSYV